MTLIPPAETAKMLVLSTAHISARTAAKLNAGEDICGLPPVIYPKNDFGWFMPIDEDHTVRAYLPSELLTVWEYAEKYDCDWVMFDRDGPIQPGLVVYDW